MSWDNTAPTAIPAAAGHNNGGPQAIAAAASPDNTAPGAIAAAGGHNNGAPQALAAAAAHNNGAPSAVAAVTTGIAFTGDTTNASAVIANVAPASIALLLVGMGVRGAGIPIGATIAALGTNTVTLSANATATAAGVALRAYAAPTALAASPAMNNGAPSAIAAAPANTDAPALPFGVDSNSLSLPNVPATFNPAFIELTGGGTSLSTLNASAADAAAGRIVQGTVNGELKSYQVRAGNDAQALPGIVRPANFNAATNAVVFVQL